ncbi:MAG: hypothetical protein QNJ07_16660 [Woeseiaceae bacterium]|nr:hypothetical protein [Woeseiaceae bacterium]
MRTLNAVKSSGRTIVALLALMMAGGTYADATSISYQGYLTDSGGVALDAPVQIGIRIFDGGSTLLYEETHTGVEVHNGLFRIAIGTGTPLFGSFEAGLFQGSGRATDLEIEIDGETLAPRRPLRSVPHAQASQDATTLEGLEAGDFLILDTLQVQNVAGGTLVVNGIQGNVETSGDYGYDAPRTYRYAVTADRFVPEWPDRDTWILASGGGLYRYAANTDNQRSYAGFNLPAGAVPTKLYCHYYDANQVGTITFLFARFLYRVAGEPATVALLGTLDTDSTFPGSTTEVRTASINTVSVNLPAGTPLMIDLQFTTNSATTSLRFYGCDVEYTLDRVSSP